MTEYSKTIRKPLFQRVNKDREVAVFLSYKLVYMYYMTHIYINKCCMR